MDLYSILGVERNADTGEIRKSYMKLARQHHPDKGGDAEQFKKIQRAYDILSDDDKKNYYDQTGSVPGENGAPEGGVGMHGPFGGGGMPFDLGGIFNMFGGMGGMGPMGPMGPMGQGPPSSRRRGKAPPKAHEINLKLIDFYKGRTLQIQFERQRFCKDCKGDGFLKTQGCDPCNGSGQARIRMMMGPGMAMETIGPCPQCSGSGKKPGPACWTCSGKCFVSQMKTLDILIEPGMKAGEKLIFKNECSDSQEFAEAGDVHIILGTADEEGPWKRQGDALCAFIECSLKEGLLGCTKMLQGHPGFPDGYEVVVPLGSMNNQLLKFPGGGMPVKSTDRKGDAIITLQIRVSEAELAALKTNMVLLTNVFT